MVGRVDGDTCSRPHQGVNYKGDMHDALRRERDTSNGAFIAEDYENDLVT